jgi:radical SAM protein with 4Fe4S-binding SPASM domain
MGPMFMTPEKAFEILDFCFSELELDNKFTIYFWGGEPLLNMKVIKAVVEKYPQFSFHTNTAGKPVTEEIYTWLKAHKNFGLTWSLGNAYEKYGSVQGKVEGQPWAAKLIKECPQNNVNLMVVKYDQLVKDYSYLVDNVTKNIAIDIATRFDHKEEDLERFADEYISLMQKYKHDPHIYKNLTPAKHSNRYAAEKGLKSQVNKFHFCKSGLERLFIDTEGSIWQCDNMYVCQHNKLGDIVTGIDYSKLDLMREVDANRELYLGKYCKGCELYGQCSRNKCLGLNLEHMGDMFIPEPSYCKMNKILFKIVKKHIEIEKQGSSVDSKTTKSC